MKVVKHIFVALLLVFVQVVVMNGVLDSIYLYPCIYVYYLFTLPINTRPILIFMVAFLIGFLVDSFSDSLGVNSMSFLISTLFYQYSIKRLDAEKIDRMGDLVVSPQVKKTSWYLGLLLSTFLIHHLVFYLISDWTVSNVLELILLIVATSSFVFILSIIFDLLFYRNKF